jgi:hypothetical protein
MLETDSDAAADREADVQGTRFHVLGEAGDVRIIFRDPGVHAGTY